MTYNGWCAIKPNQKKKQKLNVAQLAAAVEYTNCISAEGKIPSPPQVSWIWH